MEKTGWFGCASLMKLPSGGMREKGSGREQRVEAAGAIERGEVVVAADVPLTDVDLRDGAPAGALHHFLAARGLEVDADLLDLGHALRLEQPLGHQAERAHARRIHHDLRHRLTSPPGGSPAATRQCHPSVDTPI